MQKVHSAFLIKLIFRVHIANMPGDDGPIPAEQFNRLGLRQPDGFLIKRNRQAHAAVGGVVNGNLVFLTKQAGLGQSPQVRPIIRQKVTILKAVERAPILTGRSILPYLCPTPITLINDLPD